jgi:hypothetical protein
MRHGQYVPSRQQHASEVLYIILAFTSNVENQEHVDLNHSEFEDGVVMYHKASLKYYWRSTSNLFKAFPVQKMYERTASIETKLNIVQYDSFLL